jgi:ribosomal protein L14E/L6E/L27E
MEGGLVRSLAGRDKGEIFCILREEEPYLLLCDGKGRRQAHPKRKKRKHTAPLEEFSHPTLEKLARHEPVTDNEIRRALAAFRAKEV